MKKIFIIFFLLIFSATSYASASFSDYINQLRQQAKNEGISEATLNIALPTIKFLPKTLADAHHQKQVVVSYPRYLKLFLTHFRIEQGRKDLKRYAKLLYGISQYYKVKPQPLLALWGIETNYGHYLGKIPELSTLATLDYSGYRKAFFHNELLDALKMLQQQDTTIDLLQGSWAGAMGQCQFLPSRYFEYAVDYDGCGKKDIWHSVADVLASSANYLHQQGWYYEQPIVVQVMLPKNFSKRLIGLKVKKSIKAWQRLGVRPFYKTKPLMTSNAKVSLLQPAGSQGPAYLVYPNFYIIKQWNHSNFYALTVGILANRLVV